MLLRLLCTTTLCALVPVADASAATVSNVVQGPAAFRFSELRLVDAANERNDVTVQLLADGVLVRDAGTPPTPGAGCQAGPDAAAVLCPYSRTAARFLKLTGGGGDDRVTLAAPADDVEADGFIVAFLDGGPGDDVISGAADAGSGEDGAQLRIVGGDGNDALTGGAASDELFGGAGTDTLRGGGEDDELSGDGQGNIGESAPFEPLDLEGGSPGPRPLAPPASDVLDGGAGDDTASYEGRAEPLRVDLADPAPDGSPGEADALRGIEAVDGGDGPNVLLGDSGANSLVGGPGRDVIDGRGGNDRLEGSGGADRMRGGAGDDTVAEPGPGSSCGSGRDVLRGPRPARGPFAPTAFGGCELVELRDEVLLSTSPVRVRDGRLTLRLAGRFAFGTRHEVRFVITVAGRRLGTRTSRYSTEGTRLTAVSFPIRGTVRRGAVVTVRVLSGSATASYVRLRVR